MYRRIVLPEWLIPNLAASSSAILSSPYSGWSVDMRLMKLMCFHGIRGRPGLDLLRHRALSPVFAQPMTFAGFTMESGRAQSDQIVRKRARKIRSPRWSEGRFVTR